MCSPAPYIHNQRPVMNQIERIQSNGLDLLDIPHKTSQPSFSCSKSLIPVVPGGAYIHPFSPPQIEAPPAEET